MMIRRTLVASAGQVFRRQSRCRASKNDDVSLLRRRRRAHGTTFAESLRDIPNAHGAIRPPRGEEGAVRRKGDVPNQRRVSTERAFIGESRGIPQTHVAVTRAHGEGLAVGRKSGPNDAISGNLQLLFRTRASREIPEPHGAVRRAGREGGPTSVVVKSELN